MNAKILPLRQEKYYGTRILVADCDWVVTILKIALNAYPPSQRQLEAYHYSSIEDYARRGRAEYGFGVFDSDNHYESQVCYDFCVRLVDFLNTQPKGFFHAEHCVSDSHELEKMGLHIEVWEMLTGESWDNEEK